ncbi:hypothetical protein TEA_020909 [Camellia sinensis var. sinensis]|uniref:Uncharacterized protein n=1 Tax=Camellia sinensis var. sinensis TaxID=542762 RepID=A0A4S4D4M9_CAMSN|nr:hypothetical protein TEA_020909 [Camellia sinensis var. sinensis]
MEEMYLELPALVEDAMLFYNIAYLQIPMEEQRADPLQAAQTPVDEMMRHAMVFPSGPLQLTDHHLLYLAERSPELRELSLPFGRNIKHEGLSRAIRYWNRMEEMSIGPVICNNDIFRIIEAIGINCKKLEALEFLGLVLTQQLSPEIAKSLKGLKLLRLEMVHISKFQSKNCYVRVILFGINLWLHCYAIGADSIDTDSKTTPKMGEYCTENLIDQVISSEKLFETVFLALFSCSNLSMNVEAIDRTALGKLGQTMPHIVKYNNNSIIHNIFPSLGLHYLHYVFECASVELIFCDAQHYPIHLLVYEVRNNFMDPSA